MLATWGCATFPKPTLDLQFAGATSLDSRITFTRASTATYFNSAGVLTSAAINEARFDYDPSTLAARGLLVEDARTNSIRNNTMQGAAAGTPGTIPTNWTGDATVDGLSREVVGTGTENGINYIDVRFSGTSGTAGNRSLLTFESQTQVVAANGQTWTNSAYLKLAAGTLTNVSLFALAIRYNNSGGSTLTAQNVTLTPTATLTRYTNTLAATDATTAFVNGSLVANFADSSAVDFTVRIGLPQLEQGAFATSVIPTTTTALTRNADVASMTGTNFSSWYNAVAGTVITQSLATRQISTAGTGLASMDDGTISNMIRNFVSATAFGRFGVFNSGATQADLTPGSAITANTILKLANTYALNDFASVSNGSAAQTDTSGTVPTVNRMTIGYDLNGVYLNGYIQRISYYPSRLPNTTLQALTA